ncbi:MAG: hypothetical protein AAF088_20390 [Pseudomonadota bacterium]
MSDAPELILTNGHITTLDPTMPEAQALAVASGKILGTGMDTDIMPLASKQTKVIDLGGRRVIPAGRTRRNG